jgi:hypothetical protein
MPDKSPHNSISKLPLWYEKAFLQTAGFKIPVVMAAESALLWYMTRAPITIVSPCCQLRVFFDLEEGARPILPYVGKLLAD